MIKMNNYKTIAITFWYMLQRSFMASKNGIFDKIINQWVWASLNIVIFQFVMPNVGMPDNFGVFMALTLPASAAFFASINCMYGLLYDVTNEGSHLQYELTLPVPQWLAFAKYGIDSATQSFIISGCTFPLCYGLLHQYMQISLIGCIKLYIALFVTSIFSGFFALFIVSFTKDFFHGLDNVWIRVIFPMWFLGGFQFSWYTIYTLSKPLAYIALCNPLTYALEAGRASMILTSSSLPYAYCLIALITATIIIGFIGIQLLKKRMDCL